MSTRTVRRSKKVLSTLEENSPVDLYWLNRPAFSGTTSSSKGDATTICEAFWDDFLIAAKAVYCLNKEADVYDVFNFIREKFLGGWTILEDSEFIHNIDGLITREYEKEVRAGKWKTQ